MDWNVSNRDTSSAAETIGLQPEEDAADNTSVADSETERRVRNIQNTIFSSLENDLAELVRMREETIQFLESGIRSSVAADETEPRPDRTGEDPLNSNSVPAFLRDRLTYYSRPFTVGPVSQTESGGGESSGETSSKRPSYTPVAKFENAPAATPGKPYLEVGLTTCDEKAAAARRVLDKLQYGDQEDETACFVRRFWRETSTMMETPRPAQSPTAEQTASLEATIAEAFDGLRLRLQQSQLEGEGNPGTSSETGELETPSRLLSNQDNEMFRMWNEETSILNNPLNYDIWNELEEGSNTGPVIAARINMAERRSLATAELRQLANRNPSGTSRRPNTTCVGVGTNEGAELDDESSDDEEMINYLRLRCNEAINQRSDRLSVMPPSLTEESQSFFRDIGVSAEMGQDIFNMFSLQDEDLRLPDSLHQGGDENRGGMNLDEIPQPLFPRDGQISAESQEAYDTTAENVNEDDTGSSPVPQLPMFDVTPSINFCPNRMQILIKTFQIL